MYASTLPIIAHYYPLIFVFSFFYVILPVQIYSLWSSFSVILYVLKWKDVENCRETVKKLIFLETLYK